MLAYETANCTCEFVYKWIPVMALKIGKDGYWEDDSLAFGSLIKYTSISGKVWYSKEETLMHFMRMTYNV